jgi:hypothetical protein
MIDMMNKFMVGVQGERISIGNPQPFMSRSDALNLAAWLVAVADLDNEFALVLDKVRNT